MPIEALNWRVTVSGPPPAMPATMIAARPEGGALVKRHRSAYFEEAGGFVDTPVYDRYTLAPGDQFTGPAIVEERESTAVIGPGARCHVDDGLALIVEMPRMTAVRAAGRRGAGAPPAEGSL